MTYQRWFDEGPVALKGDRPNVANCPDECHQGGYCGFCSEWSCPEHGRPTSDRETAEDTHLIGVCEPIAHRICHAGNCTEPECWVE